MLHRPIETARLVGNYLFTEPYKDRPYHTVPMEHSFSCPYCGEEISMVLDLSVRRQSYVEDCEVCCNPIEVSYSVQDDALASFDAKTLE
jgi:hypothetical protein